MRSNSDKIIKGYEVGKGEYIELDPEELEAVAPKSKHTIEIEEFVPNKLSTNCTCATRTSSSRTVR